MKRIASLICCAIVLSACERIKIEDVDFDVQTESRVYNVNDTVNFQFFGNPDNITFFSGEDGSMYEFRERTTVEGTPQLEFTSYAQYGTQVNTLDVLVSTDFSGLPSATIASDGNWVNITERAVLSTGKDNTHSGIIDLSEFIVEEKPMYLAFKFNGTTGSTQKTWTIKNLKIDNVLADGTALPVTNITDAGWQEISILNTANKWSNSPNTQLRIAGGNAAAETSEDWVVTKPLLLTSVKPDAGVAIKTITTRMDGYSYVFEKAGTYLVTFVASNVNVEGAKSAIKQIEIVIEP